MSSYGQFGGVLQNPATAGYTGVAGTNINTTAGISLDREFLDRIDRMEKMMENIAERLSILDDPSPERLARHKMLKEAYIKYKFLEELCGKDES